MADDTRIGRNAAPRAQLAIVTCYAAMFMLGFTISLLGPSLPGIAQRTGITLPQAGLLFTLFSAGSIAATILLARYNDRPARRWTFLAGALLMAVGLWGVAASNTFLLTGIAVALTGLAMSTEGTVPNAIFVDHFGAGAGRALNKLHVSVGVGSFVGPLVFAAALRLGGDYTIAYRVGAALMVLVALMWVAALPPPPVRAAPDGQGARRFNPLTVTPLLVMFALAMLYTGTEQVLAGWLFTYSRAAMEQVATTASLATSLFWGAMLLGRISAVALLGRIGNMRLVQAGLALAALGVLLILAGQLAPPAFWAGVLLVGLGFGPIFPTSLAYASQLEPSHSGAVGSFFVASGSVGAMILPLTAGSLIPAIGVAGSIALALFPIAIMLALASAARRAATSRLTEH
ncbi:MAG: MFS transporter [Anaerolineae bacterium]|jgi:fucose permease|nr:MFS transporter [Anaerolineae bacterium]